MAHGGRWDAPPKPLPAGDSDSAATSFGTAAISLELDFPVAGLSEEDPIRLVLPRSAAREGEPLPTSNVCRIRGDPWLLLAAGESLEDQIGAAALAVRTFAPDVAETRFLPPALRDRLDA